MRGFWILRIVFFVLLFVTLAGAATMGLWNFLMPDLFHLPQINFWQGLAMLVLGKLLFGGFGPRGGGGPWRHRWRARWQEKLANMTPEEREKFKEKMKGRCGPWNWEEKPMKGD
jgi:hypothetical protein